MLKILFRPGKSCVLSPQTKNWFVYLFRNTKEAIRKRHGRRRTNYPYKGLNPTSQTWEIAIKVCMQNGIVCPQVVFASRSAGVVSVPLQRRNIQFEISRPLFTGRDFLSEVGVTVCLESGVWSLGFPLDRLQTATWGKQDPSTL